MTSDDQAFLALTGHYKLHPEDVVRFREIAAASVAATVGKDGCLYYTIAEDVAEPGVFRLAEGWRDRASLDRHLASADFGKTLAQAGALRIIERQAHTSIASGRTSLF
ncbi:putative quinol monooxygenase [Solimonas marina]|uniref:Antibiotic biosynthesis monooxygenase n=1 Tax=Solimonas marina TaxID=2714601 RepID=A0A969WC35_9GAMM|nr:putative quinol monooxygenase [Solimonas marina]NKF23804.1 antibiotic biosynthesis monooxygenase [Solimonas marina]